MLKLIRIFANTVTSGLSPQVSRLLLIEIAVIFLGVASIVGYGAYAINQRKQLDQQNLVVVAEQLGVAHDSTAVHEKLTSSFVSGMSREEIHRLLLEIDPQIDLEEVRKSSSCADESGRCAESVLFFEE